jgi:uncharacterized protein (DUF58 family)
VALLGLAVLAYVAARTLGTWELYFLAVAFVAALGVCWVLVSATAGRVQVTRAVDPAQPVAGDSLTLTLHVKNGSPVPGLQVSVGGAAGTLAALERPLDVDTLGPRGTRRVDSGPWPARRGVHHLPAMAVVAEDPLGLVRARRVAGEPLTLTVPPRLAHLASWDVRAGAGTRGAGRRRRPPTVDATEFRGIRPHAPGEPLNRVDWKATARTGDLMLRELEDAGDGDVAVLFNGPAGGTGAAPDEVFELGVQAAGSVADCALRTGRGVTLLLAAEGWRPLRLAPVAADRRRLLTLLAGLSPGGLTQLGPSLRALLAGPRTRTRIRSLTLVVLSVDASLVRAAAAVRDEGLPVCVVHVCGPAATDADDRDRALAAAGVRVLTVRVGDDLGRALAAVSEPRRALAR